MKKHIKLNIITLILLHILCSNTLLHAQTAAQKAQAKSFLQGKSQQEINALIAKELGPTTTTTTKPTPTPKKEPVVNVSPSNIEQMFNQNSQTEKINTKKTATTPLSIDYFGNTFETQHQQGDNQSTQPLKQYGYDIFQTLNPSDTTYQHIPVNDDYILGPGDSLIIRIWGKLEETFEVNIENTGKIHLPKVGHITLVGSTFKEAKKIIKKAFGKYYVNIDIGVSMGELKTIKVYLVGEVENPGAYDISSLSSLFNALHIAGGPKKSGSLRQIQLRRHGKTIKSIDLYDYLMNGDHNQDPLLKANDIIFVPPIGDIIRLDGSVKRPGIYELKKNVNAYTAITELGAGFTVNANKSRLKMERVTNEEKIVTDIYVNHDVKSELKSIILQNGDSLIIPNIINEKQGAVRLHGSVYRPGLYEFNENLTLGDLIYQADGLQANAYPESVEVYRFTENQKRKIIFVNAIDNPEFQLVNWDIIKVITQTEFFGTETITIEGAVFNEGTYPLLENMTIATALELAKINPLANTNTVQLYRNDGNIRQTYHIGDFDSYDTMKETQLQHNDHILINFKEEALKTKKITLTGEVKYPGTYYAEKDETLLSIINRAGGFTENAFLAGAVFTRTFAKQQEQDGYQKIIDETQRNQIFDKRTTSLLADDSLKFLETNMAFLTQKRDNAQGRVMLTFDKNNQTISQANDIITQDGDSLHIPKTPDSVTLVGGVEQPISILFTNNKSPRFYINQAGGFTQFAIKNKVYVYHANGLVSKNPTKIERGDTIYIKQRVKEDLGLLNRVSTAFTKSVDLLFKTAGTIAVFNNLQSN